MTRTASLLSILKLTIKVIFIIISSIVGIAVAVFTWIVLKPIIRAIGWIHRFSAFVAPRRKNLRSHHPRHPLLTTDVKHNDY